MAERVGRGSLTGRWEPRPGACPNIRGGITIERDLPAEHQALADGLDQDDRRGRVCVGPGGDRRQRREAEPVILGRLCRVLRAGRNAGAFVPPGG